MKKTFDQFLTEKVEDYEDKFKDTDCKHYDKLSKEEKEYCNNKRMLAYMKSFAIANN